MRIELDGGLWIGYLEVAGEEFYLERRRGEFSLMKVMERMGLDKGWSGNVRSIKHVMCWGGVCCKHCAQPSAVVYPFRASTSSLVGLSQHGDGSRHMLFLLFHHYDDKYHYGGNTVA